MLQIFRGLDYALDLARQLNVRVIMSFSDNWSLAGGVDEYVAWSPTAKKYYFKIEFQFVLRP